MPVPELFTFRRIVPSPVPVFTERVYVSPEPVCAEIDAPLRAVVVRLKSDISTPVTGSEKVTVKSTLEALVGLVPARVMEVTVRKQLVTAPPSEIVQLSELIILVRAVSPRQ